MSLEIRNLTKQYVKSTNALENISLKIDTGIIGLLGPNGAGKSTLLKLISTALKPTEGSILLDDVDIVKNPNFMRQKLGFLPQNFGVYPNLNAYEFLSYIGALKGLGDKV